MKKKILIALFLLPVLLVGCDDLFDKGDVEKTYDGADQIGLFPLEDNNDLSAGATSTTIEVQLIAKKQLSSDLPITFSADASSTAQAGVHYNFVTTSPVTLPAGSSTVDIQINFVAGSVPANSEVLLKLNLDSAPGVEVAENLKSSNVYIAN